MRTARRHDPADAPLRALLLLGATIVLLIVGLLGMHALSGGGAGHAAGQHGAAVASSAHTGHTAPAAHVAHAAHTASAAHDAAPVAVVCDDGCAAPAFGNAPDAPEHAGIAACVLALLAGLLLLVRPTSPVLVGAPSIVRWAMLGATGARPAAPRPSLTLLSISRT